MPKVVTVVVPHEIGTHRAIHQITHGLSKFETQFGSAASLKHAEWVDENTLEFKIRSMGLISTGTVEVSDTTAVVTASLPLPLIPFASRVEGLVQKHGAELLAASVSDERLHMTRSARDEIRRKARAAAEAQGLDWSRLSREQRRSFRERAREES